MRSLLFTVLVLLSFGMAAPVMAESPNRPGIDFGADGLIHPGRLIVDTSSHPVRPPFPSKQPEPLSGPPYGGDLMSGVVGGNFVGTCTNGFNMVSATTQYQALSGHCTVGTNPDKYQYGPDAYGYYNMGTLQVERYDPSGDRSYLKASKDLENKVRTTSAIYTITAGGDPRLDERVCFALGKSKKTWCGYVGWLDMRATYPDGSVHGNQAVAYEYTTTGFCPIPGDSGSPGLVGTEAVGWVNSKTLEYQTPPNAICYVWFEQLGYALSSQNLGLG